MAQEGTVQSQTAQIAERRHNAIANCIILEIDTNCNRECRRIGAVRRFLRPGGAKAVSKPDHNPVDDSRLPD